MGVGVWRERVRGMERTAEWGGGRNRKREREKEKEQGDTQF